MTKIIQRGPSAPTPSPSKLSSEIESRHIRSNACRGEAAVRWSGAITERPFLDRGSMPLSRNTKPYWLLEV